MSKFYIKARLPGCPQQHLLPTAPSILRTHRPEFRMSRASDEFEEDAVYVVLHLRNTEPDDTTFHWGLYHHHVVNNIPGHKYHIRNIGSMWIADHAPTSGIHKSMALCVVVRVIRHLPPNLISQFRQLVCAEDTTLHSIPGITCRVWVFRGLGRLQHAGLLQCADLSALEAEISQIGQEERPSACVAKRPRPIRVSALSA